MHLAVSGPEERPPRTGAASPAGKKKIRPDFSSSQGGSFGYSKSQTDYLIRLRISWVIWSVVVMVFELAE
ncbi:hypothetical protein GMST_09110 [Geomonas silvestris]|uniref:Uncharacterized protein n=1 Tax=Geomonas silvestris TaxID=2740184 RepID=A0A6V8MF04_9BACT|nr:hypothetical protein GMST_09110 [Geomonas silvestris]